MIYFLYIALVLISMVFVVTLVNVFSGPRLKNAPRLVNRPKVSVLVPARNEESNIGNCLTGLLNQDYLDFEVIVLNDQSEDSTEKMVRNIAEKDDRVTLVRGEELPDGWTGKNWACFQLSKYAKGDILIFTDADNQHEKFVIGNTVAFMKKYHLAMISAFPEQKTKTLAEKMIVPIIDFFVYGTLPLWLTYYAPNPSLAAANGQWIAFTRKSYDKIGGHQAVKNQLVEDTELSRLAKRKNLKTLTTAGTGAVYCRMYKNAEEVWQGFSKNFYGLTGYHNITFFGIVFFLFVAFILPYFLLFSPSLFWLALLVIAFNIVLRGILALRYKHPFFTSILLHPFCIFYVILIGLNSFFSFKKGKIRWKDREIIIQQ